MNETVAGYIGTFLSQIFVGLFIGICWNYGLTDLGVPQLSMLGAVLLWFGILIPYMVMMFIASNMLRNATGVIIATEPKKEDKPAPSSQKIDDDEEDSEDEEE